MNTYPCKGYDWLKRIIAMLIVWYITRIWSCRNSILEVKDGIKWLLRRLQGWEDHVEYLGPIERIQWIVYVYFYWDERDSRRVLGNEDRVVVIS